MSSSTRPDRLRALDVLRGLVIALMVIDHVRWFLSEARFDPTDPVRTTAALFFTRWVTHFCAPVFMLLAGIGAFLSLGRGRTVRSLSWFLLTRGLWLVVLELTVARFGWQFNLDYGFTGALVFWALGWSMVALAALVWLPGWVVAGFALAMILGHNLFDSVEASSWGRWGWLWTLLHAQGALEPVRGAVLAIVYPLVPWIGVMAVGYAMGPLFLRPLPERDRGLLRLGLSLTAACVVLRLTNLYGDPSPWTRQTDPARTILSFLNTTKYPPSLLFLLMTLGPALAAIPLLDRASGSLAEVLRTFGRVPLFFWLLHVPLIHLVALALSLAAYGHVIPWLTGNPPTRLPDGYGYGLAVVYAVTAGVLVVLHPLCRWFAEVKRRRREAWLSYL